MTRSRRRLRSRLPFLLAILLLAGSAPADVAAAAAPAPRARGSSEAPKDVEFPAIEDLERELSRMVDLTRNSVVRVVSRTPVEALLKRLQGEIEINLSMDSSGALARRIGSGVVIDGKGHIATLASVVSGAKEVIVVLEDGRTVTATVKGADDYSGIAVLALGAGEQFDLQPLGVGDPAALKVGSLVTAIESSAAESPGYSIGFYSGKGLSEGPLRGGRYLKINAYASPGAGGGPVLDSKGRLVGLVFGGSHGSDAVIHWEARTETESESESPPEAEPDFEFADVYFRALHRAGAGGGNITYAIPVDVVLEVAHQIIESGQVRRGWLGVTVESTEPGEIRVTRVISGSPAARADLKPGDLVRMLDGTRLSSAGEMVEQLAYRGPGSRLALAIDRNGRRVHREVVLGERPEPERRAIRNVWTFLPARPTLGVQVRKADEGPGLVVTHVHEGSRARDAGILPGDLMLDARGRVLRSIADLRLALQEQGDEGMLVRVKRGGRPLSLVVPPPPPPAPPAPPAPVAPPAPRRDR